MTLVADVTLASPVPTTYRAAAACGLFDVPRQDEQSVTVKADLSQLDDRPWSVGVITGASGRGKTTLARELWPEEYIPGRYEWNKGCVLDDFPSALGIDEITSSLTAVGFSTPPAWLRPYRVLSTGEQHRADLARALASDKSLLVVDEFSSVVDRTVAKGVSVAISRHVRRTDRQFIAVTCHKDIISWLSADWFYDLDDGTFHWGPLQRPPIGLTICEGSWAAWPRFRGYHYLSADLHRSARVFVAIVELDGEQHLAGFEALLPSPGRKGLWRSTRTVVLPDYQGLGIGNAMIELIAEGIWAKEGKRWSGVTSSRALIAHRLRRPEMWRMTAGPGMQKGLGRTSTAKWIHTSAGRLTTSWSYIPEELRGKPASTRSG